MQTFRYIWEKNVFKDDETGKIIPKKSRCLNFYNLLNSNLKCVVFFFLQVYRTVNSPRS